MVDLDTIKCDLTVIGAGMAGMAATLFAVNRGISVAQVGSTSEIGFASGLFDLLGVHPVSEGNRWDDKKFIKLILKTKSFGILNISYPTPASLHFHSIE